MSTATTIEIGLIVTLIASVVGLLTFFIGRQSAAKKEGERWGRLESDIAHMRTDISRMSDILESSQSDNRESIRRLHKRINDHLRDDHKMSVPQDD